MTGFSGENNVFEWMRIIAFILNIGMCAGIIMLASFSAVKYLQANGLSLTSGLLVFFSIGHLIRTVYYMYYMLNSENGFQRLSRAFMSFLKLVCPIAFASVVFGCCLWLVVECLILTFNYPITTISIVLGVFAVLLICKKIHQAELLPDMLTKPIPFAYPMTSYRVRPKSSSLPNPTAIDYVLSVIFWLGLLSGLLWLATGVLSGLLWFATICLTITINNPAFSLPIVGSVSTVLLSKRLIGDQ